MESYTVSDGLAKGLKKPFPFIKSSSFNGKKKGLSILERRQIRNNSSTKGPVQLSTDELQRPRKDTEDNETNSNQSKNQKTILSLNLKIGDSCHSKSSRSGFIVQRTDPVYDLQAGHFDVKLQQWQASLQDADNELNNESDQIEQRINLFFENEGIHNVMLSDFLKEKSLFEEQKKYHRTRANGDKTAKSNVVFEIEQVKDVRNQLNQMAKQVTDRDFRMVKSKPLPQISLVSDDESPEIIRPHIIRSNVTSEEKKYEETNSQEEKQMAALSCINEMVEELNSNETLKKASAMDLDCDSPQIIVANKRLPLQPYNSSLSLNLMPVNSIQDSNKNEQEKTRERVQLAFSDLNSQKKNRSSINVATVALFQDRSNMIERNDDQEELELKESLSD